jgi:hypothetical protein
MAYARKNINSPTYRADRFFYVCSYGGCASWMLVDYLNEFGNVYHVHSKCPPRRKLTYIGREHIDVPIETLALRGEWFNDIVIPEEEVHKYKVIYIYKEPINVIYSRFSDTNHLANVECDPSIKLTDVIREKKDLYGITNFYQNYTEPAVPREHRNYKIYCVKYEDFFDNIEKFNEAMEISNCANLYPRKKERANKKNEEDAEILREIYGDLIEKMRANDFIKIV